MSLQARTYFAAAVSALIGLALSALILWWSDRFDDLKQELDVLARIRSGASDLGTATFEYALYREDRPHIQAQRLLPRIRGHLDELSGWPDYQGRQQRELWAAAYTNLAEYENLLNQLTPQVDSPLSRLRDRRTVSLLLSRSHSTVNAISALARPLDDAERRMRAFGVVVVAASVAVLTGLPFVAAVLLRRFVLGPVARLGTTVAAVGAGNLEVRLRATSRDEFGTLAGAFDTMLDRLEAEMIYARGLIEASLDPLVTISADGKITDVNRATEEVTGLPRTRLVNTDFSGYFTDPDAARAAYRKVFSEGLVRNYPLAIRHDDGHLTDVVYNASLYRNPAGEIAGVFAAARDITERKRVESELAAYQRHLEDLVEARTSEILRANERLATANTELEAFSYSVSHDLRVPLRAIDGFSRILLEDYRDKLDPEGQRLLNVVRDSTSRMAQLIDDILRFSRAGRVEMSPVVVDMEGLARAVLDELRPSFVGRALSVDIKPLPMAMGDRAMLRQVWANLLSNAIKFTAPKAAATVVVDGLREGGETVYRVRDDGVGFDARFADKLFGVFQRLHPVEEFEGTGIGLAIVKRIVVRHGGRVWAEGEVNAGATFCFALPNQETAP